MKEIYMPLATLLGLGLTLGFYGCAQQPQKNPSAKIDSVSVRQVEVSSAVRDTVTIQLEYSVALKAKTVNVVSSKTGGRLQMLSVREGDRVAQGQTLCRLDRFNLSQAKVQLDDAQRNYERMRQLYEVGGISKQQHEQAQSTLQLAREAYADLEGNTMLSSSISGVVTARHYEQGDRVPPGQPILVVEQISPIKAEVQVSEEHYALLRKGRSAMISVDALQGRSFPAKIANIFPTINPVSHTVTVEVESPNGAQELRPGMYSRVQLDLGSREALLIPDKAVLRQVGSGERYVYVLQDGKAIRRVVDLGGLYGDRYEIRSGLEVGEAVIISSPSTLTNGQAVGLSLK